MYFGPNEPFEAPQRRHLGDELGVFPTQVASNVDPTMLHNPCKLS